MCVYIYIYIYIYKTSCRVAEVPTPRRGELAWQAGLESWPGELAWRGDLESWPGELAWRAGLAALQVAIVIVIVSVISNIKINMNINNNRINNIDKKNTGSWLMRRPASIHCSGQENDRRG